MIFLPGSELPDLERRPVSGQGHKPVHGRTERGRPAVDVGGLTGEAKGSGREPERLVRRADGVWLKGFFGWLEVLRVLPRWSWLASVLSLWPFTGLGPVFYRHLAKRRYQLFGVPPPCDDAARRR